MSINAEPYTKMLPNRPGADETLVEKVFVRLVKTRLGNKIKGDRFWLPSEGAMRARAAGDVVFLSIHDDNTLTKAQIAEKLAEREKEKAPAKTPAKEPGKAPTATK